MPGLGYVHVHRLHFALRVVSNIFAETNVFVIRCFFILKAMFRKFFAIALLTHIDASAWMLLEFVFTMSNVC